MNADKLNNHLFLFFQREYFNIEDALQQTDVLYMTRIQKERFDDEEEYEKVTLVHLVYPPPPPSPLSFFSPFSLAPTLGLVRVWTEDYTRGSLTISKLPRGGILL